MSRIEKADKPRNTSTRKSRNGCFSCKKLHIKCDEAKPSCEYCSHTNRDCIYPEPKIRKSRIRRKQISPVPNSADYQGSHSNSSSTASSSNSIISPRTTSPTESSEISLQNDFILSLNSPASQLNLNNFELRLLTVFQQHGGEFFSLGVNKTVYDFWTVEIPKIWQTSPLIKTSTFALSSLFLWTQYELNSIHNVYVDDDKIVRLDEETTLVVPVSVSLSNKTNELFQYSLSLLMREVRCPLSDDPEKAGEVLTCFVTLFSVIACHPFPPLPLVDFNHSLQGESAADIMEFCNLFYKTIFSGRFELILNSKFHCLMFPEEVQYQINDKPMIPFRQELEENGEFQMIEHLKEYLELLQNETGLSWKTQAYETTVEKLNRMLHIAVKFNYPLPIFRAIFTVSITQNFPELIRSRDYPAMKIMYYYCCINSIADFKIFKSASIWDDFIEEFKQLSFFKFGDFEEVFDQILYNTVKSFKGNTHVFKLEMLFQIGTEDPFFNNY